nr:MAG TPA: hypothetical protein [Crassvirales sp.]
MIKVILGYCLRAVVLLHIFAQIIYLVQLTFKTFTNYGRICF